MKMWIARDTQSHDFLDDQNYTLYGAEPSAADRHFYDGDFFWDCGVTVYPELFFMLVGRHLSPGQFCQIEVKPIGDVYYFEDEK